MPYGDTKLMKSQSFIYRIDTKYALSTINILYSISLLLCQYQLSQMPRKLEVVLLTQCTMEGHLWFDFCSICKHLSEMCSCSYLQFEFKRMETTWKGCGGGGQEHFNQARFSYKRQQEHLIRQGFFL